MEHVEVEPFIIFRLKASAEKDFVFLLAIKSFLSYKRDPETF